MEMVFEKLGKRLALPSFGAFSIILLNGSFKWLVFWLIFE
jgi:hypothetical protein